MFRLYESYPRNYDSIEAELVGFQDRSDRIADELASASQLIQKGIAEDNPVIDQVELARAQVMLEDIEQEHHDFEIHSEEILILLDKNLNAAANNLESRLDQEEDEYDRHVERLRLELDGYTERAALRADEHEQTVIILNVVTTALAALVALVAAYLTIQRLIRPIHALVSGTRAIGAGQLDLELPISTRDEIGDLTASFNQMVRELQTKEKIKSTFGQYVDPRIVEGLIDAEGSPLSNGEKRVMTVFFSDIAGFTPISEQLTPASLVRMINEYLSEMTAHIRGNKGVIDKYVGDAIMAFWGPPFCEEDEHPGLACRTALAQINALHELNQRLPELLGLRKALPELRIRIGMNSGEVLVGNIGSEQSRNFTVMGDAVNLASRLESVNKQYGTNIMVAQNMYAACRDDFIFRRLDSIRVKGKEEPVNVYELLHEAPHVSDAQI
ncbi:MAG: HAMP domain-containing protein, partial [Leptospiraceae bacterium]|nr:HAMP domain-containing protein [Leptospiraceae bacterium]